jgi:hypothetical protein
MCSGKQGRKAGAVGDLMHVAAVQFDDLSMTIAFDSANKIAQEQHMVAYATRRIPHSPVRV